MKHSGRDCAPSRSRSVGKRIGRGPNTSSRSLWGQVVNVLPAPIVVVDAEGSIVAMNEAFRNQVRESAGEVRMQITDLGDNLMAAIRTAASGSQTQIYRTSSSWGLVFDCRRLDEQAGLVALIAAARPSRASSLGGSV
jgi:PAS domain-containing protein